MHGIMMQAEYVEHVQLHLLCHATRILSAHLLAATLQLQRCITVAHVHISCCLPA
jgi:hypothetical protein